MNYYELLEISKTATEDEIKKGYKKLALKHHPDKNPDNREEANKQFLQISEAYKRITEPDSFKDDEDIDMEGMDEESMSAMFNMMFSEMMGGVFSGGIPGMSGMAGFTDLYLDSDDEEEMYYESVGMGGGGGMPGMSGEPSEAELLAMLMGGAMGGGGMPPPEMMAAMAGGNMPPGMMQMPPGMAGGNMMGNMS